MAVDAVLLQLVREATEIGAAIPLVLDLPSGRLRGHLTSAGDFSRWATGRLNDYSSFTGDVSVPGDDGYLHLVIDSDDQPTGVVRVNMSAIAAWSVGSID